MEGRPRLQLMRDDDGYWYWDSGTVESPIFCVRKLARQWKHNYERKLAMNKVKVIGWESDVGAGGESLYRLDNPKDGVRLFRDLLNNAETDGCESIQVKEIDEAEWLDAVKNGERES